MTWFQTSSLIIGFYKRDDLEPSVLRINPEGVPDGGFDERLRTFVFFKQAQAARRRKRLLQQALLPHAIARRKGLVILVCCLITILLTSTEASALPSCRRLHRNLGWWDTVWRTYSDATFKKTFRISRATLQRQTVAENPISPRCRLGICPYRIGRGDYYYTISQMTGFGLSTVSTIVQEICEAIVKNLWAACHPSFSKG